MPTCHGHRSLSPDRKAAIRRGLLRSWKDGAHHKRFHCHPVDADTVRQRELWDRKGRDAPLPDIQIRHSHRRSDGYDVFLGNHLACTGGRAKVGLFLGSLLP